MLAGLVLLRAVRAALDDADAEAARPGPSDERRAAEEAVAEIPALEEEAMIADDAFRHDVAGHRHGR